MGLHECRKITELQESLLGAEGMHSDGAICEALLKKL